MSQKPRQAASAPIPRLRFALLIGLLAVWALVIAARLVYLQVFQHKEYAVREARQQERTFQIAPRRGMLYDRDMQPLAMTVLADSIYAVPSEISDKSAAAAQLARIVHQDPTDRFTTAAAIQARLKRSRAFAWVARKLEPATAQRVMALNMKGIYVQKEFKRYYPEDQLAAQVLGYVSLDDDGLGGIEHRFDGALHGAPGRMLTAVDARSHSYNSTEREPKAGQDLVLTIDSHIQFIAEKVLDWNMERTQAQRGMIVVQDPNTGQILALAVRPTFDPNQVHKIRSSMLRDPAVSDVYEPGSVFKLVTYSAALDSKAVTPDSMLHTLGGQINVAGRIVHDDRDAIRYEAQHGNVISATQALEQSSDVAAIELAERMGVNRFYQYIRAFGFGQRTGIELPAETRGLLKPPQRWQPTTIGSIPMGQEIGVTPVQIVSMVSTIANGGVYLPPHILLQDSGALNSGKLVAAAFHPEHQIADPLPPGAHRVISTLTAAEMRRMMEDVVLRGTGIPAQLNGYSAAGKTGTAQKIDPRTHTYSKTDYIASFAGFAPVNDPAISVVVVMDSPAYRFHYGTQASAPAFRQVAQQILEYLGVPHDEPLKSAQEMAKIVNQPPPDEGPPQHIEDLDSLFAEVNHLPADDPLRTPHPAAPAADAEEAKAYQQTISSPDAPPATVSDPSNAAARQAASPSAVSGDAQAVPVRGTAVRPLDSTGVASKDSTSSADDSKRVKIPGFNGQPLRSVVAQAANLGLQIRVYGTGVAAEQAPAPGTMVPRGTTIVVRFQP
jgi:cell division protein FtsI (penicillin-binding protein 3)